MTIKTGGKRNYSNDSFNNLSNNGNFWSATENSGTNAWKCNLNYNNADMNRNNNDKTNGFSFRYLKDWKPAPLNIGEAF